MKKLFYYCLLLLPTLLIWQCKDDDYPPLPPVDTSLKFHVEDTLVMSTAGGSSTISLQSAKDWKLDVEYDATDPDKDWLSTDPTSGTASGTASVTVTTLASLVERKATLVLSQVGEDTEAPVRLVVRQDVDGFSVEKKNYPVGYEESVVHVKFLTNVTNYAAEVAEKDQKWIIPLPATMATTEGSLSFTIKKNTGPAARTGTITIYDADGNASSVDVTVTQEGAPVTGSIIYEGDNALDAVMMNVNGEYVSWVLRKDADEIVQGEANHISETGWWYATPPVSGSNIQYGGAAYGGVDYTFDQGPIAVRFPMPFPMTTLCFIGTNVKFSLYPWNTDYATTTAQTPVLEESFTSGEWQYPGGNPGGGLSGRDRIDRRRSDGRLQRRAERVASGMERYDERIRDVPRRRIERADRNVDWAVLYDGRCRSLSAFLDSRYVESEKSFLFRRYNVEYDRRVLPEQGDGR